MTKEFKKQLHAEHAANQVPLKKQTNTFAFLIFFLIASPFFLRSQTIPGNYYGINGWMPYSIGTNTLYGKLDEIWDPSSNYVKDLGLSMVRYGGHEHDIYLPTYTNSTTSQCAIFINKARENGMEPVIQIPFLYKLKNYYPSAMSLTTAINNVLSDPSFTTDINNFVTALTNT